MKDRIRCKHCNGVGHHGAPFGSEDLKICGKCYGTGYEKEIYIAPCIVEKIDGNNPKTIQVGGDHYRNMKIQPVEFITSNSIPYLEGNVIKYICRHRSKGGAEDLKKAKHYIDLLLQHEYPDDN